VRDTRWATVRAVRLILLLRSAVAQPGRRLSGVLVILTVIIGVVTMHSMSGSPTAHGHGPHDDSVATVQNAITAESMSAPEARDGHVTPDPAESGCGCCDGCGGHDAAMAMCLMILVALLAFAAPARRLLWRALPAWSMAPAQLAPALRAAAPPSLHELCISRT
jgi:hypothetical protein